MKRSQIPGTLCHAVIAIALLLTFCASSYAQSPPPAACADTTPHTERLVTVAPGVQLQVLDWGGAGKPDTMVLLTGLGDNAHIYDDFAFQFTDYFHVIGITRRGYLPSSQPGNGYEVATRALDDISVLDALGISKAVFVGHSLAASELNAIATAHKDRVEKLVYLDAYDLAERFQLPEVPVAPFVTADLNSLETFQAARARLLAVRGANPSICLQLEFNSSGKIAGFTTPDSIPVKLLAGIKAPANPPVNWKDVAAPRLGIFALYSAETRQSYYWYLSAAEKKQFDQNFKGIIDWQRETIDEFRSGNPKNPEPIVVDLPPGNTHYIFLNNEAFVVRRMRQFLLGESGN
ncbi:MAG TPA: alpha/beta hydrolase [Candidatus Binataceae bacterium]|nr:alpha/beta hydrolase [Candidatus Binataceae bacterium]